MCVFSQCPLFDESSFIQLAMHVANSIKEKRAQLQGLATEWDRERTKRVDALDAILDSLTSQVVPPDFYTVLDGSESIFGSQHFDDQADDDPFNARNVSPVTNERGSVLSSPSDTIRLHLSPVPQNKILDSDKRNWKTLRDFVDDQAIEDILEDMDSERNALEVCRSL